MNVDANPSALLPQPSQLTPELKDFIQRILVPILVDRYLEERKLERVKHRGVHLKWQCIGPH
jgi:hypothetical protein